MPPVRWAWPASKRPRPSSLQSGLAPGLLCYRQLHAVKSYVHDIHHYMHCIISLFWFLNNHVKFLYLIISNHDLMTAGAQNASGRPTESSEKGKSEPKPVTRTEETTQSGRKRGRDPPASNPKRPKVIRPGKIEGDQVLMKIGRKLGVKWMDVGVELGMKYEDLKNTIKDDHNIEHHLKPMDMFQKWKSKAGDSFTYATLASALEEVGLDTCAQTHCYMNNDI